MFVRNRRHLSGHAANFKDICPVIPAVRYNRCQLYYHFKYFERPLERLEHTLRMLSLGCTEQVDGPGLARLPLALFYLLSLYILLYFT